MSRLPLFAGAALMVAACSEQGFTPVQPNVDDLDVGGVSGRVCDPVSLTWLGGATVYTQAFDENDLPYATISTTSNSDGRWTLDELLPAERPYDIYIQNGQEILETHSVKVIGGETINLAEPECYDPLAVAVITGDYDDLSVLLSDIGVFAWDTIAGTTSTAMIDFLSDFPSMREYDVILFNGGHVEAGVIFSATGAKDPNVTQIQENIRNYVQQGGVIYATDWSYDTVEQIWPDMVDFLGDDSVPEDAQVGEVGTVTAQVVDSGLASYIGQQMVEVEFDLPVWPPIESVTQPVSVMLQTDQVEYREGDDIFTLNNVPLLIGFSDGKGQVLFSSYRLSANASGPMSQTFGYLIRGDEE